MILKGLKVIELASVLAGPSVGTFLAECGAEVIKIENPHSNGDITRGWKLKQEHDINEGISSYFASINWGKQSILVDYLNNEDLLSLKSMFKDADIIISSFKAGDGEKFGLDYQSIKKINPKIILGRIEGYSHLPEKVAFDVVLQAETGYLSMNGEKNGNPCKIPVALIDIIAGHQLKEAILLAYIQLLKTGKGSEVVVSLYDAAISGLINQASAYLINGIVAQKEGSLHPNIAPYGEIFISKDGIQFVLAVGTDYQFNKLLNILNLPKNEMFESNSLRLLNRSQLFDYLQNAINQFYMCDLERIILLGVIPIGIISDLGEVLDRVRKNSSLGDSLLHKNKAPKQFIARGIPISKNLNSVPLGRKILKSE